MPSNGFLPWGSPLQPKATGLSGSVRDSGKSCSCDFCASNRMAYTVSFGSIFVLL